MNKTWSFCEDGFFNVSASWLSSKPEFSKCFQYILPIIPSAMLWILFLPLSCYSMRSRRKCSGWRSCGGQMKMILNLLLILLLSSSLIKSLIDFYDGGETSRDPLLYLSTGMVLSAFIMSFVLMIVESKKSTSVSVANFLFFFLLTVACIIPFYMVILRLVEKIESINFYSGIFCIFFAFVVAQFILHGFSGVPRDSELPDSQDISPRAYASLMSKLAFSWLDKLVRLAFKRTLTEKDVFVLEPSHRVSAAIKSFDDEWSGEKARNDKRNASLNLRHAVSLDEENMGSQVSLLPSESKAEKPSLMRAMFLECYKPLFLSWFLRLTADVTNFTNPLLLQMLISFTANESEPTWHGGVYAFAYVAVIIFNCICMEQYYYLDDVIGMKFRSTLALSIYRKALRLSNDARGTTSSGEIVNLVNVDVERISYAIYGLANIWSSPFQLVLCLSLLWFQLGIASLVGTAIIIVVAPLNIFLIRYIKRVDEKLMKAKDKRIKILTEMFTGMKVIKLYGWELSFEDKVTQLRAVELSFMRLIGFLWKVFCVMWLVIPSVILLSSILLFLRLSPDNVLTPQKAFVSLALFDMLRNLINTIPMSFNFLVDCFVSSNRIRDFLCLNELNFADVDKRSSFEDGAAVEMEDATFSWKQDAPPILKNISVRVEKAELVAIVGAVGSGKSSLLSAILGELTKVAGNVTIRGDIAYASQVAWIQNMTLQDNILFGKPMNKRWYKEVLRACALQPDLDVLPAGDLTEIGERGINLSGGQKQRVNLARAVYQQQDIYFLDDPLSAVDAHVGKELFEKVLGPEGLLANRTRILVTHSVQWLPFMDRIFVVKDGGMKAYDSYRSLNENEQTKLQEFVRLCSQEGTEEPKDNASMTSNEKERPGSPEMGVPNVSRQSSHLSECLEAEEAVAKGSGGELVKEEETEAGRVSWRAYLLALRARGVALTVLLVALVFASESGYLATAAWLSVWSAQAGMNASNATGGGVNGRSPQFYVSIYAALTIAMAVITLFMHLTSLFSRIRTSRILHRKLLHHVLRAPMSFIESTPVGRLINRFGKDIDVVDKRLENCILDFFDSIMGFLFAVGTVAYNTSPYFIVALVPLTLLFALVQGYYIPLSRQTRRLRSVSRSPLLAHFTESIFGASVIRAFRKVHEFTEAVHAKIDNNARFYLLETASNKWLETRLTFIGALIVGVAVVLAVIARDSLAPSIVGLTLTYAIMIRDKLVWATHVVTTLETESVALERLKEYMQVDPEADWQIEGALPPGPWPPQGAVAFQNYSTRYREDQPLILHSISVTVAPGEKIGIVGRTGAGKSSLAQSLFRLIEAVEGSISIDGLRSEDIGLHQLRQNLTILPQDPVLFYGSLRFNLDPFDDKNDAELWAALRRAGLGEWASGLEAGLEHDVGEGGGNLSVGQRQLLCLSRALLRRSKVLLLDEATASVDLETDRLVMATVREEFSESTVFIIAHRLATIMNTDRVMVLNQGRIEEFDSPSNLLKNRDSYFYGLASDAGLISSGQEKS